MQTIQSYYTVYITQLYLFLQITILIQAKQKKKTAHAYLKSITREVTTHIRNAQGGPLISVFRMVSSFNSNFSFTLNFSFQKNNEDIESRGLRLASSKVDLSIVQLE